MLRYCVVRPNSYCATSSHFVSDPLARSEVLTGRVLTRENVFFLAGRQVGETAGVRRDDGRRHYDGQGGVSLDMKYETFVSHLKLGIRRDADAQSIYSRTWNPVK